MTYHEEPMSDEQPNVYNVTVPLITHVTLRVEAYPGTDDDELASRAIVAWKQGAEVIATGPVHPDYDDVTVALVEDNNPEPEVDDDPREPLDAA